MKKKYKLKDFLWASGLMSIVIVSSFYMVGCVKNIDPINDAKLIVDYNLIQTEINFRFYNAKTKQQMGDGKTIAVTVTGSSSAAVIDFGGNHQESYDAANGFLSLYLNPNDEYVPTPSNPVTFNIVTSVSGYLPSGKTITIPEEGNYFVDIMLVEIANPPVGVTVKTMNNVGPLENGALPQEVTLSTDNNDAAIILPQGIVLKDSNGNPLQGAVDIMLVYFDPHVDESLAAYPGGLITSINQNGKTVNGVFYSAGFIAVEITGQNNVSASEFSNGEMQMDMNLPLNVYNPNTKSYVEPGETVSLYSYNATSGEWNFEKETTIFETEKKLSYAVSAKVSHLSYWNFDWFWSEYCYQGAELEFTGNYGDCACINMTGTMRKTEDNTFLTYVYVQACQGEPLHLIHLPAAMPVYIEWNDNNSCSDYSVGPDHNPLWISDLCESQLYQVPFNNNSGATTTVNIEISGECAQYPGVRLLPTFGVWFRKSDDFCWNWAYMQEGEASVCNIEPGADYVIGVYMDNSWEEWNITVDQEDYYLFELELPDDICSSILN